MLAQSAAPVDWTSPTTIAVAVLVILVILAAVVAASRRRRPDPAQRSYRVERGTTEPARRSITVAPLTPGARTRYREEWAATQARFVDDPRSALDDAHRIIVNVLRDRGYPAEGEYADDLGAESQQFARHYREARALAANTGASTEEMRLALTHYRAILDPMLGASEASIRP